MLPCDSPRLTAATLARCEGKYLLLARARAWATDSYVIGKVICVKMTQTETEINQLSQVGPSSKPGISLPCLPSAVQGQSLYGRLGTEAPCAGKQRLCPPASGSLPPARSTWRVTPWTCIAWQVAVEKSCFIHLSCAFFSANKAWSGVSSQSPCLFREKGCSQQDFCPPTHLPPPLNRLVLSHQPVECREFHGVQEIELGKVGRGKTQGWQAQAVQAFDNIGTPRAGPGPDGSSGLVTLTQRKDRLGLWHFRGRPASSMESQEVSQAEPGIEVQRGGRHRRTEALELQEDGRRERKAHRVAGTVYRERA